VVIEINSLLFNNIKLRIRRFLSEASAQSVRKAQTDPSTGQIAPPEIAAMASLHNEIGIEQ
jgi:hypothetical protein